MGARNRTPLRGLALQGFVIGLVTGLIVYAIAEYWVDEVANPQLPATVLFFVVSGALAFLLLAEKRRLTGALAAALAIAGIIAVPDYFMMGAADGDGRNLTEFPAIFWFGLSGPIVAYLLTTLAKAAQEEGAPPPYSAVFFHGLTLPLIVAGAALFALLAIVLLFAWAALLKSMDVSFFHETFQEPWFMLPFLGAVGGLSTAMMRGQDAVLGALRLILLLFCRIAIPIMAVFSVTFIVVLATNGTAAIVDKPYPGAIMLGLAFAAMLIFNGVYQNGEGGPPGLWLRIPTLVTLASFPVYAGVAAWAFWLRVDQYGLTPGRVAGVAMTGLAAAYSLVCIAGIVSEFTWRTDRWMPLVAPINTAMTLLWIVVLIALATPVLDPWALSAHSQYARLADGELDATEFDYGYLRFRLGAHGEKALDRLLALEDHPQAVEIRRGVERARAAPNYWTYEHGDREAPRPAPHEKDSSGPMDLELNPKGANAEPDDSSHAPAQDEENSGDPGMP
ncbi:MAG: DUF4153 domain-containing protein [Parvularculaceae bacterium]